VHIETDKHLNGINPARTFGFRNKVYHYDIKDPETYRQAVEQLGDHPVQYVAGGRI
jgi:hypothetical protein